jgi:hypothetical protein
MIHPEIGIKTKQMQVCAYNKHGYLKQLLAFTTNSKIEKKSFELHLHLQACAP